MLAVSKKFLPRAVDRNRVKRIAREAWRSLLAAQPSLAREVSVFVRLARRPAMLDALCDTGKKRALRVELDQLLQRLPRTGGARS